MDITIKAQKDSANSYGTKLVMNNDRSHVKLVLQDKDGKDRTVEVLASEFFPGVKALEAEAKASER